VACGRRGCSSWVFLQVQRVTEAEGGRNGGVWEEKRVHVSWILPVGGAKVFMREKGKVGATLTCDYRGAEKRLEKIHLEGCELQPLEPQPDPDSVRLGKTGRSANPQAR
jgi:hypothetical protein